MCPEALGAVGRAPRTRLSRAAPISPRSPTCPGLNEELPSALTGDEREGEVVVDRPGRLRHRLAAGQGGCSVCDHKSWHPFVKRSCSPKSGESFDEVDWGVSRREVAYRSLSIEGHPRQLPLRRLEDFRNGSEHRVAAYDVSRAQHGRDVRDRPPAAQLRCLTPPSRELSTRRAMRGCALASPWKYLSGHSIPACARVLSPERVATSL
jgi:hypothetical protein